MALLRWLITDQFTHVIVSVVATNVAKCLTQSVGDYVISCTKSGSYKLACLLLRAYK